MAVSFAGAKKYRKHNGLKADMTVKKPIPSNAHFYTLLQGGIKLEPCVETGDSVLCGQKLADIAEFDAIPVISGCSGTVTAVTEDLIEVKNDMLYAAMPHAAPPKDSGELTSREIMWLMREGGVYETRYSLPLHVLLSEKRVRDCIILCCFDSDPYVSSPQAAAYGNSEKLLEALKLVMRVSGIRTAYVAVENDTKKTFADFKAILRYNDSVTPCLFKARYPQSQTDILIKSVTGRGSTNALILSPETLVNMIDVLETGRVVTEKLVTVSGDDILEPENFAVPIGATASSVIESGGYASAEVVINGGIIGGEQLTDLDTPVTRDTKALIAFHNRNNIPKYKKKLL